MDRKMLRGARREPRGLQRCASARVGALAPIYQRAVEEDGEEVDVVGDERGRSDPNQRVQLLGHELGPLPLGAQSAVANVVICPPGLLLALGHAQVGRAG